MSYLRIHDEHLKVPGKLAPDELAFLAALAQKVPNGGHIVEIGPFYGRSTRVMALANPRAKITSIDTFEDVDWTKTYAARHHAIPAFGQRAFEHYTKDLGNVSALKGPSPEVASRWSRPIDMYFEDAVHGNPTLHKNINFWTRHLRPGGIACGHDFTLRFPDIKREVRALSKDWGAQISIVGSLWALQKPPSHKLMPGISDQPRLEILVKNKRSGLHRAQDAYWCGAHLEADRMLWIEITPPALPDGLRLEGRVGHPTHGASDWFPAGQRMQLTDADSKPLAFDRIAFRLAGKQKKDLQVGYRVSARQIGKGGWRRSGTSQLIFNGKWARAAHKGLPINAVSLSLYDTVPADPQRCFPDQRPIATGKRALGYIRQKLSLD